MKRGFTLIELVVAVAVLAIVASFAGAIFNVSIDSHRTAGANAEIMQKLRAVTDQLNSDFAGIRKDAPMAIQFWLDVDGTRRDSIAFFANGDFQSVRQYPTATGLRTVVGNVASIYYGQASGPDPNILARKQKILTSDSSLEDRPLLADPDEFLVDSLAVWKVGLDDVSFPDWVVQSPRVDLYSYLEEDLPLYVMEGVASFMIQIAQWDPGIWFPHSWNFVLLTDRDGDGRFGFFYNVPLSELISESERINDWYDQSSGWPKALKFTFTLYDSKGIIKDGRTFTHIVYVGD